MISRRVTIVALLLLALGWVAFPRIASANAFEHGKNVVMTDAQLGPDDEIDGDLNIIMGKVTCDGAQIHGDVHIIAGEFDQVGDCKVDGRTDNVFDGTVVSTVAPWISDGTTSLLAENETMLRQLAYGVVVLLAFLLFPARVRIALNRAERYPGVCAVTGVMAFVAVIPVAILLVLSIIGIPLVVLEFAALLAGLWIGQAAVALLVGRRLFELLIPRTTPSPFGALVLGLVVVSAAEIVPVVGWAVTATVWLLGLGAAILGFVGEGAFTPTPIRSSGPIGGTPMKTS